MVSKRLSFPLFIPLFVLFFGTYITVILVQAALSFGCCIIDLAEAKKEVEQPNSH